MTFTSMADSNNSSLIVKQATVNDLPATYVLGSYSVRVTFHSQQTRAFNLIWALFDQKLIVKGSRIGIVGGGLAGMTAAAAAKLKGCDVFLYESEAQLMSLQRGNSTRYIHPNIYDWPLKDSEVDKTDLPCLNWSAAKADEVIEQIEQEWELLKEGIKVKTNRKVSKVFGYEGQPRIDINDPFDIEKFDCVILAAGFGVEKSLGDVPLRTYWENDNLHQKMKWAFLPKKILVTGCGDGGLVDYLRLRFTDFKHAKFTAEFLENESLKELRDKLLEIEANAPNDAEKAPVYFIDQYKGLTIDDALKDNIRSKLRSDTKVTLNSGSLTPLNGVSSILNRFAIYLLIAIEELTYIGGKIEAITKTGTGFSVVFDGHPQPEFFDDVIVRHGPVPLVQDLVPLSHVPVATEKDDPTARQLWPAGFYPKKADYELQELVLATPPYGKVISIIGSNGLFVSTNGEQDMTCDRQYSGSYERFLVVDAGEGKFALQNNGKYVTSQNGSLPVRCDRSVLNAWEKFEWIAGPEGIGIKGNNSRFVSSQYGSRAMTCNTPEMKSWEIFKIFAVHDVSNAVAKAEMVLLSFKDFAYRDFHIHELKIFEDNRETGETGRGDLTVNDGLLTISRSNKDGRLLMKIINYHIGGKELPCVPKTSDSPVLRRLNVRFEAKVTNGAQTLFIICKYTDKDQWIHNAFLKMIISDPDWEKYDRIIRLPANLDFVIDLVVRDVENDHSDLIIKDFTIAG